MENTIIIAISITLAIFIFIFSILINSSKTKGKQGEKEVNRVLSSLDNTKFKLLKDVYIKKNNGRTTEIDHILILKVKGAGNLWIQGKYMKKELDITDGY